VIWLWVFGYLIVGVVVSRLAAARKGPISTGDAAYLVFFWPLVILYLAIMAIIRVVGTVGGGRD
jgi:hypothetical protein